MDYNFSDWIYSLVWYKISIEFAKERNFEFLINFGINERLDTELTQE